MSKIRKDNFTVTDTPHGPIYGRVLSVRGSLLTVATDAGESASVLLDDTRKITAAEYRENAGKTSETYEAADSFRKSDDQIDDGIDFYVTANQGGIVKPEHVEKTESVVKPAVAKPATTVTRRPLPKGTGKKAVAIKAYKQLVAELGRVPSRKEAMTVLTSSIVGCTKHGASTYYYNLRDEKDGWV